MFHWKKLFSYQATSVFRLRSDQRDQQTDLKRFEALKTSVHSILESIKFEKNGLQGRYEIATSKAAFLSDAIENADAPNGSDEVIDVLTNDLIRYNARIRHLSKMTVELQRLSDDIERLGKLNKSSEETTRL